MSLIDATPEDPRPITARQQVVLEAIRAHVHAKGYGPTMRELMRTLGVRSTNAIVCHLVRLERKGFLTRSSMKSRGIQLLDEAARPAPRGAPPPLRVPLLDAITDRATEQTPRIVVPRGTAALRADVALRVQGTALYPFGWDHGDVLFCARRFARGELAGRFVVQHSGKIRRVTIDREALMTPEGETIALRRGELDRIVAAVVVALWRPVMT